MIRAKNRLVKVLTLLKGFGLSPSFERVGDHGYGFYRPKDHSIHINAFYLNTPVAEEEIDYLVFALLHELGHAIQNVTNFYPEMHRALECETAKEHDRAVKAIKGYDAKDMHLEAMADAFAVDMCLRLGIKDPMRFPGYI